MAALTAAAGADLLAVIRPAAWDLPLFVHVAGAMLLVGAAGAGVRVAFLRDDAALAGWSRRLTFRTLLLAALPAFVVMRIGAEWIRSKEFGGTPSLSWVTFGYTTADGGGVLLVAALVLTWLGVRRSSRRLVVIGALLMALALAAWFVTVWVMAAKPL